MLSINQLRAAVALDTYKNFRRAAESISISQPALTLSIKNSEETIGKKLFDRSHSEVNTTEAGRLVVEHGRYILGKFGDLEIALNQYSDASSGEVEFGIGPYIVKNGFSSVLEEFCRLHPNIRPRFHVDASDSLQKMLMADQISFYVASSFLGEGSDVCTVQPLLEENVIFAARSEHPLCRKPSVDAKDLVNYPFVGVTEEIPSSLKDWFLSQLSTEKQIKLFSEYYPYIVCDYYEATCALLLSTDYLTGGPEQLLSRDLDNGPLRKIELKSFSGSMSTGIVSRNDRTMSPASLALQECFKKLGQE